MGAVPHSPHPMGHFLFRRPLRAVSLLIPSAVPGGFVHVGGPTVLSQPAPSEESAMPFRSFSAQFARCLIAIWTLPAIGSACNHCWPCMALLTQPPDALPRMTRYLLRRKGTVQSWMPLTCQVLVTGRQIIEARQNPVSRAIGAPLSR